MAKARHCRALDQQRLVCQRRPVPHPCQDRSVTKRLTVAIPSAMAITSYRHGATGLEYRPSRRPRLDGYGRSAHYYGSEGPRLAHERAAPLFFPYPAFGGGGAGDARAARPDACSRGPRSPAGLSCRPRAGNRPAKGRLRARPTAQGRAGCAGGPGVGCAHLGGPGHAHRRPARRAGCSGAPYQPARARAPRPVRTSPKVRRTRARASARGVTRRRAGSRAFPAWPSPGLVPAALVGPLGSCRAVDRRAA
jgi:hypothetical protein